MYGYDLARGTTRCCIGTGLHRHVPQTFMVDACILAGHLRGICRHKVHLLLCLVALIDDRELIPGHFGSFVLSHAML
jgi:hypothetical protein